MDLGLNETQDILRRIAREFLEAESPNALVRQMELDERGYPPELYRKIAEQGWASMILPEEFGGDGASFLDLCVLNEELGRAIAPVPLHDVWLSQYLLLDLASDEQKKQYLPALGSGDMIATIALTEPSARYDAGAVAATAEADGGEYVLNGTKLFVSNANIADLLLVVARTRSAVNKEEGISVFAVPANTAGVAVTQLVTIALDKQCEVVLNNVRVPASALVGPLHGAWPAISRVIDKGKVLICTWSVGGASYVLEMTVDYAKSRVQFGRPIGTFQAISHKCADMAIDVDGMRFVVYHAAWRLSEGLPADQEIAIAKGWTADAYRRVTALGHQVHGGVGFMMDYDIQMYFRRAKMAEVLYGDADLHRELVAQGLGL